MADEQHIQTAIPVRPQKQMTSPRKADQSDTDVSSEVTRPDETLPEGLRRPRRDPLSPTQGRGNEEAKNDLPQVKSTNMGVV